MQAGVLLALAGQGLAAWGAGPSSPLRPDALSYLQIRAVGSPATVLFLVAQVRPCAHMQAGQRGVQAVR